MSTLSGSNGHRTEGSIGVMVLEDGGVALAVNNFSTDAAAEPLQVLLTIRGKLEKRKLDLGPLPQRSGAFQLPLPPGTDVSLFNTLVILDPATSEVVGSVAIA